MSDVYIPKHACDRCSNPIEQKPGTVQVTLLREGKNFTARWCSTCAVVLWDQLADLSTFHEVRPPIATPNSSLLDQLTRSMERFLSENAHQLMHGDGCDSPMTNGWCNKCGIAPSMQDTYFR